MATTTQMSIRSLLNSANSLSKLNHTCARNISSLRSSFLLPLSSSVDRSGFGASVGGTPLTFNVDVKGKESSMSLSKKIHQSVVNMAWGGTLASVRLIIQGKHMQMTDSIKSYIEEKIGHAVKNHTALVREVDVRCSLRGGHVGKGQKLQRCEITIYTKKHGVVRAEEEDVTLYAAIDEVAALVARKLRKIKEKDGGHGRPWYMKGEPDLSDFEVPEPVEITEFVEPEIPSEDEAEIGVVRTKYFDMQPMSVEAALDQMINIGHEFFAFREETTGEINVLYKRRHSGYGRIVPRSNNN